MKKTSADKEGGSCACFDVIVNPNEIRVSDIDSRSKTKVCICSF